MVQPMPETHDTQLPVCWPPTPAEWPYWLLRVTGADGWPAEPSLTREQRERIGTAFSAMVLTCEARPLQSRVQLALVGTPPTVSIASMPCQICGTRATIWRRVYFDGSGKALEPGNWVAYCERHAERRGR